ncbi:MAG TPA: MBL fold metallo-hydrolase [Spirochaetia bacterium]|nr:MBL fold metallo-hydrolase [Spirochaetia bacterium]
MTITVHRGCHEIGGLSIELSNASGERILLDVGRPLVDSDDGGAADMERLSSAVRPMNERGVLLGVMFSHGHQDHIGFDRLVPAGVPRWVARDTLALYRLKEKAGFFETTDAPDWERYQVYQSGTVFSIGHFTVTPWLMDHSAIDAHAFEIRADGQRVVFTGDFRRHGRKGVLLKTFLASVASGPDALLIEGTTLSRADSREPDTERDIEDRLVALARDTQGQMFIQCSAENVDRIVGIYRACRRTGRTLVVDLYTAMVLKTLAENHPGIPCPGKNSWQQLRVWYPQPLTRRLVDRFGEQETVFGFKRVQLKRTDFSSAGPVMMLVRPTMRKELQRWMEGGDHAFIYSLWNGYLEDARQREFVAFMAEKGASLHTIHTSGHADARAIADVIAALKPRVIIPVHTENPGRFQKLGDNVVLVSDKQAYTIDAPESGGG